MQRKRSTRIPAGFDAELISGTVYHKVVVENFSEDGVLITTPAKKTAIKFIPGITYDLEFELLSPETAKRSGEKLKLHCRVVRAEKIPDGITNMIGMEIMEKSLEYEEFLKILYSMNIGIL